MEKCVYLQSKGIGLSIYSKLIASIILIIGGGFKFLETFFSFIDNRNSYFIILLLLLSIILLTTISNIKFRTYCLFGLLLSFFCAVIGDMGIPYSIMLAISLYIVGFNNGIKKLLISSCICSLICVIASLLFGFNSQYNGVRLDGTVRYTLGFSSANTFPSLFLNVIALIILFKKKMNIFTWVIIFITSYIIFLLTNSRASFFSLIVVFLFSFIIKHFCNYKKSYLFFLSIFPLFTFLSFALGTFWNIQSLNDSLSGRPYYYSLYIENNTIAWISGRFLYYPEDWYLDNLFLTLIYRVGVPMFVLSLIFATTGIVASKKVLDKKTFYKTMICYLLFMFFSIEEAMLTTNYNICYVIFAFAILKYKFNYFSVTHSLIISLKNKLVF